MLPSTQLACSHMPALTATVCNLSASGKTRAECQAMLRQCTDSHAAHAALSPPPKAKGGTLGIPGSAAVAHTGKHYMVSQIIFPPDAATWRVTAPQPSSLMKSSAAVV